METEIRMDGDALDEVVGFGSFHLEQMDDNAWFLLLGDVAVFLTARGAIKATVERRSPVSMIGPAVTQ